MTRPGFPSWVGSAVRGAGLPVVRTTASASMTRPSASRTDEPSTDAASPVTRSIRPGWAALGVLQPILHISAVQLARGEAFRVGVPVRVAGGQPVDEVVGPALDRAHPVGAHVQQVAVEWSGIGDPEAEVPRPVDQGRGDPAFGEPDGQHGAGEAAADDGDAPDGSDLPVPRAGHNRVSPAGRTWPRPCRRRCTGWPDPCSPRAASSRAAGWSGCGRPRRRSDGRWRWRRR